MNTLLKYILRTSLLLMVCTLFYAQTVSAAPAAPIERTFLQPSGESFQATLSGDEWLNWATTKEDDVLVQDTDGYWKYAEISGDKLKPGKTKHKVQQKPKNNLKKKDLLQKIKDKKVKKSSNASSAQTSPSGSSTTNMVSLGDSGSFQSLSSITQTRKILLLLVEFSNVSTKYSEADWYNRVFGASGNSVNSYYQEVSNGIFQFTPVDESYGNVNNGVIKVKLNYLHPNTGSNTGYANQKIVMDALAAADPSINFSVLDTNNDGIITDNELLIVTVVAGNEAACGGPSPSIWAHKWGFSLSSKLDGKSFGGWKGYTQQSELQYSSMATIGVLCHELGHDLGLPDLYDYDYSSEGVGIHSLMAGGSWGRATLSDPPGSSPTHMDAWSKAYLGFVTPQVVESPGSYTVNSFDTLKYSILKIPTTNPKEYFLIENRQFLGFDRSLARSCKSGGIAIWHIDESFSFYRCNDNELHKMVDLEEANEGKLGYSQLDKRYGGIYEHYYYTGSFTTFTPTTVPGSGLYNGTKTNISVSIASPSSSSMTVNITKPAILLPKGALEVPVSGSTVKSTCSVSGWFLDQDGVMKVDVIVDGVWAGQAIYGDNRPDIGSKYPEYNNTNSGFHYDLDVSKLSEGLHTLSIQEISKTGTRNTLPPIELMVENIATTTISYTLSEAADITVQIYDSSNILVKTLESKVRKSPGMNSVKWNGRDSAGKLVEDGIYTYKIMATDTTGLVSKPLTGTIIVERAPYIKSIMHTPDPFNPDGMNKASIKYVISENANVTLSIYDRNNNLIFSKENIPSSAGENTVEWDGKDNSGKLVTSGAYTYKVIPVDSKGNKTTGLSGIITVLVDTTPPIISSNTVSVNPFTPVEGAEVRISYTLSENAKVMTEIFDSTGNLVRTLENNFNKPAGGNSTVWDGKDKSMNFVKDGDYKYTIQAVDLVGNKAVPVTGTIMIRSAPSIGSLSISPNPFTPGGSNTVSISYTVSLPSVSSVKIYTGGGSLVRAFENNTGNSSGSITLSWDGRKSSGTQVADGTYTVEINAVSSGGIQAQPITGTVTVNSKASPDTKPVIDLDKISPDPFDPTDGNTAEISYSLSKACSVTINILDSSNAVARVLESSVQKNPGMNTVLWDGKNASGASVPDGTYGYSITATDSAGQSTTATGSFVVKRFAISITSVSDSPDPFIPNGTNKAAIKFTLSKNAAVVVRIFDSKNMMVNAFAITAALQGENTVLWDGKNQQGVMVGDGVYTYTIDAEDAQGNKSNHVAETIMIDTSPPTIDRHYVEPPIIEPD